MNKVSIVSRRVSQSVEEKISLAVIGGVLLTASLAAAATGVAKARRRGTVADAR